MAQSGGSRWRVIGGGDKGGILVRQAPTASAAAEPERLATGALVEQLEEPLQSRLHYRLVQGLGPKEGWVAISLAGGKELLQPLGLPPELEPWNGKVPEAFADPGFQGEARAFHPLPEELFNSLPKPRPQQRMSVKQLTAVCEQNLPGEFHGITFPHNPEQLYEWGPVWLTKAFHKAGTMPESIAVISFDEFRVLAGDTTQATVNDDDGNWGGAGMKVILGVTYDTDAADMPTSFFIKIPHRMGGKSERHKVSVTLNNDFPEVMFNTVCAKSVPFRSPQCYFADMNRDSTNFIVICERIPYGDKTQLAFKPYEVLPAPGKYTDFELESNGAEFYYAQAQAFARMAAWYQRSEYESLQLDYLFMVKEQADSYIWNRTSKLEQLGPIEGRAARICEYMRGRGPEAALQEAVGWEALPQAVADSFLAYGLDFLDNCPVMFPPGVLTPEFKEQFKVEMGECNKYGAQMDWFITEMYPEMKVLAHPNLQIDNAFYWKDGEGRINGGLLDWGSTCLQSMAKVLTGGWHSAEVGVMDEHEDQLSYWFVDQVLEAGGTCCEKETFLQMIKLSRAAMTCGMFGNLMKLYQLIPKKEWKDISGRLDPKVQKAFLVRCYGTGPMLVVSGHKSRNPMPYVRAFLKSLGIKP